MVWASGRLHYLKNGGVLCDAVFRAAMEELSLLLSASVGPRSGRSRATRSVLLLTETT